MTKRIIKAIETVYSGYRFRSRLEARWAVFFDGLGIEYEYEPEGFDLGGDFGRYLPDFFLPAQQAWVEVKQGYLREQDFETWARALIKTVALAFEIGADTALRTCLLICGEPYLDRYTISGIVKGLPPEDGFDAGHFALGRRDERELWVAGEDGAFCLNVITDDEKWPISDSPKLIEAYILARQARFEHGQKGAPSKWPGKAGMELQNA